MPTQDGDGLVNVNDLLSLLSGACLPTFRMPSGCGSQRSLTPVLLLVWTGFGGTDAANDVNSDGNVDVNDLLQLLLGLRHRRLRRCRASRSPEWCPDSGPSCAA